MEASVRKNLADRVLKAISSEAVEKTRRKVETGRAQVLFLEDLQFINDTINKVFEKGYINSDIKAINPVDEGNLKIARDIAKVKQNSYIKRNKRYAKGKNSVDNTLAGRNLKNNNPEVYAMILRRKAFLVGSFSALAEVKGDIIKALVKDVDNQLKEIIKRVDRGHGAGEGLAVTAVTAAKAFGKVDQAFKEDQETLKQFNSAFSNYLQNAFDTMEVDEAVFNDIKSIIIKYEQVVTKRGGVKASYIPFVTFQDKYTNRGAEQARETEVIDFIRGFFQKIKANEILELKGSSTLEQKVFSNAISKLITIKVKNKTININANIDPRKIKPESKGKATSTAKTQNQGTKGRKKQGQKNIVIPRGRRKTQTQNSVNIKTLLGIMNSRINDVVAKNMRPPRLETRTWRFASSVRITDISTTRQGFPSIGYTYQKNPYGVFENTSGTRFASPDRDPRKLIDASVREVAALFGLGRIYTRREG